VTDLLRLTFLLSAALVVLLRSLLPFTANFDQSAQLEAAHRLVQGLGLTSQVFALHNPDISQPPVPQYLTWWSPGSSLLLAAFLALKLPLVPAVKFVAGGLTIAGWFGWGRLVSPVLCQPIALRLGGRVWVLPVQYALAACLPLFYTPTWTGTDLLLWAMVPFVVQLALVSSSPQQHYSQVAQGFVRTRPLAIAGVLVGISYSFRYASVFLALVVVLILCQHYKLQLRQLLGNIAMFVSAFLVFWMPLTVYNRFAADARLYAAYRMGLTSATNTALLTLYSGEVPTLKQYLQDVLNTLSGVSSLFGMTNLSLVFGRANNIFVQLLNKLLGVSLAVFVILLPLLVMIDMNHKRQRSTHAVQTQQNLTRLRQALTFIPLSLVLLLTATMSRYSYPFLRDARYYLPAIIPVLAVSYGMATGDRSPLPTRNPLRMLFVAIVSMFLLYNIVYRPVGSILLNKSASLVQEPLLATSQVKLFSNELVTGFEQTKQALTTLHDRYPQAIIYAPQAQLVYDAPPWLRVSMAEGDFWNTAYTSRPVQLILTVFDICTWRCPPATVLEKLAQQPGFQTVQAFPEEFTRIIMVELPAGYRFTG
jgi:hypothetical protein